MSVVNGFRSHWVVDNIHSFDRSMLVVLVGIIGHVNHSGKEISFDFDQCVLVFKKERGVQLSKNLEKNRKLYYVIPTRICGAFFVMISMNQSPGRVSGNPLNSSGL